LPSRSAGAVMAATWSKNSSESPTRWARSRGAVQRGEQGVAGDPPPDGPDAVCPGPDGANCRPDRGGHRKPMSRSPLTIARAQSHVSADVCAKGREIRSLCRSMPVLRENPSTARRHWVARVGLIDPGVSDRCAQGPRRYGRSLSSVGWETASPINPVRLQDHAGIEQSDTRPVGTATERVPTYWLRLDVFEGRCFRTRPFR
jgi:hypothetical protein